jgi:hypothetical protein
MSPVRVSVSYQLGEYMSVVREFAPQSAANSVRQSKKLPSRLLHHPAVVAIFMWLFVPPIFFTKVLRVGRCDFEFTELGMSRTSKGTKASRTWQEVVAVHKLSRAYLIELEKGAMPVPYRVFASHEQQGFEALLPPNKLREVGAHA